eukprot:IDg6383t1
MINPAPDANLKSAFDQYDYQSSNKPNIWTILIVVQVNTRLRNYVNLHEKNWGDSNLNRYSDLLHSNDDKDTRVL